MHIHLYTHIYVGKTFDDFIVIVMPYILFSLRVTLHI